MVCPLMKKISMSGQLKKKDKNKIATTKKPIVLQKSGFCTPKVLILKQKSTENHNMVFNGFSPTSTLINTEPNRHSMTSRTQNKPNNNTNLIDRQFI